MKILVLNGSPRGERSNTMKVTEAFLEGLGGRERHDMGVVDAGKAKIGHCLGCFACWKDSPGRCVIRDDMDELLPRLIAADLVVWSLPLYYFSMPSKIKALMDRMLPLNLPFMDETPEGGAAHPPRYDLSHQRHLLVSTCGFFTAERNYEALATQFKTAFGEDTEMVLCPEGELFSVPELRAQTGAYLDAVRRAGREYLESGAIGPITRRELSRPIIPPGTYRELADASWGIDRESAEQDPSAAFVKQMAALYNPAPLAGKEALLAFRFTELGTEHRLHLGRERCVILDPGAGAPPLPTTRIETPFSVWSAVAKGELDGARAMMDGKYRVEGDFDLMLKLDELFSGPLPRREPQAQGTPCEGKRKNMGLAIYPWLPLWIILPLRPEAAPAVALGTLCVLILSGFRWSIGRHERIAFSGLALFTLGILAGVPARLLIPASYLAVGAHWLLSCLTAVPLTADYTAGDYGGAEALQNALFVKTNRIITAAWGGLYVATALWTIPLLASPLAAYTGVVNTLAPALCGLWTAWFKSWYPARVARGAQIARGGYRTSGE